MFLVRPELRWLGERNHRDRDTAAIEFTFERFHLTEVVLARQSCQMPEKDYEQAFLKVVAEAYRVAAKIQQSQLVQRDLFHRSLHRGAADTLNRAAFAR